MALPLQAELLRPEALTCIIDRLSKVAREHAGMLDDVDPTPGAANAGPAP